MNISLFILSAKAKQNRPPLFNNLEPSAVPTASAERRKQNRLLSRENPTMPGSGTMPDRRADASGVRAHRYAPTRSLPDA